jgi:regulator of protease activity HflC (stomatin/prohibitin superfamily)
MFKKIIPILALSIAAVGCTRIETGEVGLRVDMSKQIQSTELMEGSWNQTLVGEIITFPVRDVGISVSDRHPLTVENTPLQDFDAVVVYNISPAAVSDLWGKKARAFHNYYEKSGDWHLMESYIVTMIDNSINKVVRKYKALEVNDNRTAIEAEIKSALVEELKREKLDTAITFGAVQVRNITPNQQILDTAIAVVKSQNELKIKANEVDIAKKEAERMAALSANSGQSIAYMQAEAQRMIAQGIANGKVHTIVVPMDFKGMVNVGK